MKGVRKLIKIQLTSESNDGHRTLIEGEVVSYHDLISLFRAFSLAIGYQPETINSYIDEE